MTKTAIGFVETKGLTGIIDATDVLPKTSELDFFNYVSIGGGFMNTVFKGDVGAVKTAVQSFKNKANFSNFITASNVIPRPHQNTFDLINNSKELVLDLVENPALGMIETVGWTPMIEGADAGVKAADVVISGWITVGGGYSTVFFRGDVAAVKAAVQAGEKSAANVGKVISSYIIPRPHSDTNLSLPIGKHKEKSDINEKKTDKNQKSTISTSNAVPSQDKGSALGIIETKGFIPLVEAVDTGLKQAEVSCSGWYKVGSALVSTIFRGEVAAVKASVEAAAEKCKQAGELVNMYVIPRPHQSVEDIVYKFVQ